MIKSNFLRFILIYDETGKSRGPGRIFREINPGKMTRENGITGEKPYSESKNLDAG